ncbi:MAG: FeoA family protein [Candidatus Heimdallarchaeaceae archaeon]|jgi:Fe2+ transport system protein FeoA
MNQLLQLIDVDENKIVLVKEISAGHKAQRFLADLGIHEGENIRITKNDVGPIIVEIKRTRVAVGRGLASKIKVLMEG